jgi:hypothetical protein
MIDGALRTMIDEVLIWPRKMSETAVAPARHKRHLAISVICPENWFPLFGITL